MFDQKVAGELTSHSLISGFEKILTIIALGLPEGQHCLAFTITTIRSNWLYRVAKIPTPALEFSWTKSVHCHQAPSNSAVHYRAMLVERNNITWGKCMWLCRWYWNRVIRIENNSKWFTVLWLLVSNTKLYNLSNWLSWSPSSISQRANHCPR